jgi:DMSO/TMAO reductase YedYZ molybdopterin-dependent catalytic subunit
VNSGAATSSLGQAPVRSAGGKLLKQLPVKNGAPLRLRVERQLGYKQAKYLMRIDLVERLDQVRGGKGGYWEDLGYEWYAGI